MNVQEFLCFIKLFYVKCYGAEEVLKLEMQMMLKIVRAGFLCQSQALLACIKIFYKK